MEKLARWYFGKAIKYPEGVLVGIIVGVTVGIVIGKWIW